MRARLLVAVTTFVAGSILNPAYMAGCGEPEPDFQYGAEEMGALIESASAEYTFEANGVGYRAEIDARPAETIELSNTFRLGLPSAHACGTRHLVSSAAACIDASDMPVQGTLSLFELSEDGETPLVEEAPISGTLFVPSLTLNGGSLTVEFEGGRMGLEQRGDEEDGFRIVMLQLGTAPAYPVE